MSKLFTFGDSFTKGDGVVGPYGSLYKKDENDVIWPELVAKKMNLTLKNKGISGASNDSIIDSIINSWDEICENDFVIIGKSWSHRFDFPQRNNSLIPQSIVWRGGETDVKKWFDDVTVGIFNDAQIECIKTFSVEFATQPMYAHRQNLRLNFLKNILIKEKKVKFIHIWDVETLWNLYENIKQATDGEIQDVHWSYKGHKDFCDFILKLLIL